MEKYQVIAHELVVDGVVYPQNSIVELSWEVAEPFQNDGMILPAPPAPSQPESTPASESAESVPVEENNADEPAAA